MKTFFKLFLPVVFLLLLWNSPVISYPKAGFALPDSITEFTLKFKSVNNLIVLPVRINDDMELNLILDTGCRNLVLFGKRFQNLFHTEPNKSIQFSGLGSGKPVIGSISLNNKVAIGAVLGERIPIVIVPHKNLFSAFDQIHGVIGYDIFLKFEIELNPVLEQITFRTVANSYVPAGYTKMPIAIVDARPILNSSLMMNNDNEKSWDLMIDTGSSLGLLLKSTDVEFLTKQKEKKPLGRGLNGTIEGIEILSEKLILEGIEMLNIPTGIIKSTWHNHASIGMGVLKDYALILNYVRGYACLKRLV